MYLNLKARLCNQGIKYNYLAEMLLERYRIKASKTEISIAINKRANFPKQEEICKATNEILKEFESAKNPKV